MQQRYNYAFSTSVEARDPPRPGQRRVHSRLPGALRLARDAHRARLGHGRPADHAGYHRPDDTLKVIDQGSETA